MAHGLHLVTQQSQAKLRAARRRELRAKLNELIDRADQQHRAQDWDAFEDTRAAIRLVLSDLASDTYSRTRVFSTLPPSPTAPRRRGE